MERNQLETAFRQHEGHLWGLCYRMTGVAADADELVQDTFVRLAERPPPDLERSLGPWLTRVAANLARDRLKQRRRRGYRGPWLPAPVPTELVGEDGRVEQARYEALESASLAFLVALEALTPNQRVVLVLRDVFGWSTAETAEALGLTLANTKVTLHRARRAMAPYDDERVRLDGARAADMLARFMLAVARGDAEAAAALMTEDAVAQTDANGVYTAAGIPLIGPQRVARVYVKLGRLARDVRWDLRSLNGLPALVVDIGGPRGRAAPRFVLQVQLDRDGRIRRLFNVQAPDKLTAIA